MLPAVFHSFVPKDSFLGDLIQPFLKQFTEVHSPEVQHLDSTLCQAHVSGDHKLNQGTVAAAQTASNLNLFDHLLCMAEHQVQQLLVASWSTPLVDLSKTCTRKSPLLGSRSLLDHLQLARHVCFPAGILVVKNPPVGSEPAAEGRRSHLQAPLDSVACSRPRPPAVFCWSQP